MSRKTELSISEKKKWDGAFGNGDPVWFSFGVMTWSAGVIEYTAWREVSVKSDAPQGKVHYRQYSQIRHRDPAQNGADKPEPRKEQP